MQPLSRATGASSLAFLSHFSHFLRLPPRSGGHFCVKSISLTLNQARKRSAESRWTNASIAITLACGSVYLAAAERRLMLAPLIAQGTQQIRSMLMEAVLGISDGVEAVLSSVDDALIQLLLLQ